MSPGRVLLLRRVVGGFGGAVGPEQPPDHARSMCRVEKFAQKPSVFVTPHSDGDRTVAVDDFVAELRVASVLEGTIELAGSQKLAGWVECQPMARLFQCLDRLLGMPNPIVPLTSGRADLDVPAIEGIPVRLIGVRPQAERY